MSLVVGLPQVNLQGLDLSEAEARALVSLRVQQKLMLPSACELVFSGAAGRLPSGIQQGKKFRLQIEGVETFVGTVTALNFVYGASGERELRIRAYDALHSLRLSQMVRAHVDVTVADLAREFSKDANFGVNVLEDSPLWSWLLQHNQTNFEFLRQAADESGLVFYMVGEALQLFRLEGYGNPVDLLLGREILEANIDINNAYAFEEVHTAGWQALDFTQQRDSSRRAGQGVRYQVNRVLANERQARARSQSEEERRNATRKVLWALCEGDGRLFPGVRVRIDGMDEAAKGTYTLASVSHTVDSIRGFVSEISSQPPAPATVDMSSMVTVGEVSRIGGPNGRIKVQLNAFEAEQDIETEWLSVLAAGAGADKGLVVMPEVGDTVLVLLVGTFPMQGIVLGSVYGAGNPPDEGIVLGKRQRFLWRTRNGQSIQLDDSEGILRLTNRDGSVLELAPNLVRLLADTDLEIAAPGKTITIRGNAINFEQG